MRQVGPRTEAASRVGNLEAAAERSLRLRLDGRRPVGMVGGAVRELAGLAPIDSR